MELGRGTNKNADGTCLRAQLVEKRGEYIVTEGKKVMNEIIVRQSELKRWLKCRRATYWGYTEGWTKPTDDKDVRGVGTHFHGLLAEYYGDEESEDLKMKFHPDDVALSQVMYDTYIPEVEEGGMDVGQETVAVEKRMFSKPIQVTEDTYYIVSCQVDQVYADSTLQALIGRDHKTSAAFFNTAENDFQLMTYAMVLHDNGYLVDYMEHNIVKRNKRTGRAKPPFIQRNRIYVPHGAVTAWRSYLKEICWSHLRAHDLSDNVEGFSLYPNPDKDCSWGCDFVDVCSMVEQGEDYTAVLETEYQLREEEPHVN